MEAFMENSKIDTSKIVKYLKQVEEAKNEAIKASYTLEEVKTTSKKLIAKYQLCIGSSNNINSIVEERYERQEKAVDILLKKMLYWENKVIEIRNFIESLNITSREKTILTLKYVCNKSSHEIGDILGLSVRHINRIHIATLKALLKQDLLK